MRNEYVHVSMLMSVITTLQLVYRDTYIHYLVSMVTYIKLKSQSLYPVVPEYIVGPIHGGPITHNSCRSW